MAEMDSPAAAADKNLVEEHLKRVRLTADDAFGCFDFVEASLWGFHNAGSLVDVDQMPRCGTPAFVPRLHQRDPVRMTLLLRDNIQSVVMWDLKLTREALCETT